MYQSPNEPYQIIIMDNPTSLGEYVIPYSEEVTDFIQFERIDKELAWFAMTIDETGRYIALVGGDASIWDRETQSLIHLPSEFDTDRDFFQSVDISSDGRYLAAGSVESPGWNHYDARLAVWDLVAQEAILTSLPDTTGISEVAFHPNSELFVYARYDGSLHFLDTQTWREVAVLQLDSGKIDTIKFTPDGTRLLVVTTGSILQIFGVEE